MISVSFDKRLAFDKLLALAWGVALVAPFSPQTGFLILIVTAYSHFALSHLYQFKRNPPSPFILALFAAACAFFLVFAYNWPMAIVLVALPFTMFHCLWDEFKLMGEKTNPLSGCLVISAAAAQTAWLVDTMFPGENALYTTIFIIIGTSASIVCAIWLYLRGILHLTTNIFVVAAAHIIFTVLYFTDVLKHNPFAFYWAVIHFHGMSYYLYIGRRFLATDTARFKIYLRDIVLMWAFFVGGYILYKLWPEELSFLRYVFYSASAFYGWAMMHLITTFRLDDYRNIFRLPRASASTP